MKKSKKIGVICSPGGHFLQALRVLEAFEGQHVFFLTYSEKATSNRQNTYYVKNIGKSPIALIIGVIRIFFILWKERPDILFSTGSEIAVPCFYFGKFLFHTKLIYLESGAKVYHPSLTGKWVYPITDLFLVQWEPLLKRYASKAKYVGALI